VLKRKEKEKKKKRKGKRTPFFEPLTHEWLPYPRAWLC
jgi:hypothetical protein